MADSFSRAPVGRRWTRRGVVRGESSGTTHPARRRGMTSAALLEAIGELDPGVLYVVDCKKQRFAFAADRVVEMLGYPRSKIHGASFAADSREIGFLRSRLSAAHRPLVSEHIAAVCQSPDDSVSTIIVKLHHADGSWRWFEARSRVLTRDPKGHVTRIVGLLCPIKRQGRRRSDAISRMRVESAERSRLARELHDGTAQDLLALDLSVARAERYLTGAQRERPELMTVLDDIRSLASHIKQELRVSVLSLRLPELEKLGLQRALEDLAEKFAERTGVSVTFETTGGPAALSAPVEHALWRLAQEGLINVYKHARARSAHLTLGFKSSTVEFELADDGSGAEEPHPNAAAIGMGLRNMCERVAELGGAFSIVPRNSGFVIKASLERDASEEDARPQPSI